MPTFKHFEEIDVWQKARVLTVKIYQMTNTGPFAQDFGLRDQTRRCCVSIMANIAEGFARKSNKEFAQYLFISKSSATEVQSHLYVALDQNYITQENFHRIYAQCEKVSKMDSAFIKYLNTQLKKPNKPNKSTQPNEPNKPK